MAREKITKSFDFSGGWIESLERKLVEVPNIELGVAFSLPEGRSEHFTIGKRQYYVVPTLSPKGRFGRIANRLMHEMESLKMVDYYLEVVRDFKPDIVHIFGTEREYGLVIPKIEMPTVIQIQGNLTVYSLKWFSGISTFDILRCSHVKDLITGRGLFHEYYTFLKRAQRERKILSHCRFLIGRTEWDKRVMSIIAPQSKYFHCDEVLREDFYKKQWRKQERSHFVLGSVIRNATYKGLETIYESAVLVNSILGEAIEWRVWGLNDGDEMARVVKNKYGTDLKEQGISLLGLKNSKELCEELLKIDLFVHASHIENSPNSVCEAMLLGMPIVSTSAGGTSSLLQGGVEGLLVQDGDPHVMSGAILELLRDQELAIRLGKNARARALKRHNPKKIVKDIMNIYKEVLVKEN